MSAVVLHLKHDDFGVCHLALPAQSVRQRKAFDLIGKDGTVIVSLDEMNVEAYSPCESFEAAEALKRKLDRRERSDEEKDFYSTMRARYRKQELETLFKALA